MTAQHPDDILAMRMMKTARLERKLAAERDGIHPGGLVSAKRPGAKAYRRVSDAGQKARDILAAQPGLSYRRLSALSGLSLTACRDIIRAARGGVLLRANPRGEGGAPRRPGRLEADRLAREGKTRAEIMAATGVSRATAARAICEAQKEAAA